MVSQQKHNTAFIGSSSRKRKSFPCVSSGSKTTTGGGLISTLPVFPLPLSLRSPYDNNYLSSSSAMSLSLPMISVQESEIIGMASDTFIATALAATGDIIAQVSEKKRIEENDNHCSSCNDDDSNTITNNHEEFLSSLCWWTEKQEQKKNEAADKRKVGIYNSDNGLVTLVRKDDDNIFQEFHNVLDDISIIIPEKIDSRRTYAYGLFSGGYTGGFQHFLFPNLQHHLPDPITRLFINQFCIIPLVYFPILLWLVPKLRGRTVFEQQQLRDNIDIIHLIPKNWAFWLPLQFIQFTYIPAEYQIIYVSIAGLVWKTLLSMLTNEATTQEE